MTNSNDFRRVVVTGTGVVSPLGSTTDKFWDGLKRGVSGVGPITGFETQDLYITIAAECTDFEPRERLSSKLLLLADRYSQFAGAAASEAFGQSGLEIPLVNGDRAASIIGSGAGGLNTLEKAYYDLFALKKKATHPLTLLRTIGSSACAHVGIDNGIKGPTFGTVSACATASHALGLTFDMIRRGSVDIGVAGASEAVINYGSMRAWQAMRVLSPEGCFPFSKNRNGTVLAEGAGILVMEELEHARARGANILAEVKGFGMTSDAADMVNPDIEGPTKAMQFALNDAGLNPEDIDYLNAHGTATTVNDANETGAIKRAFGDAAQKLAISSTKSMHGHLLGAGGGVEAVACIMAAQDNFAPPTIGYEEADPECDLDYVPNIGREMDIKYTMSNSFAFGGLNASIVFGPPPA